MNRNYSILAMILVIFVVVGVFLFVVFKSDRFNTSTQIGESSVENTDVANYIEPDNWDSIINDNEVSGEIIDEINTDEDLVVEKEIVTVEEIGQNSPETGAGTTLAIVAIIISLFVSIIVYKKQKIA